MIKMEQRKYIFCDLYFFLTLLSSSFACMKNGMDCDAEKRGLG